jgi:hypothetical protein
VTFGDHDSVDKTVIEVALKTVTPLLMEETSVVLVTLEAALVVTDMMTYR